MDLILDTDALLWMSQGDPRLGSGTRTAVDAATRDGSLRFAAISMLEVARLHWDGRIELPAVPEVFFEVSDGELDGGVAAVKGVRGGRPRWWSQRPGPGRRGCTRSPARRRRLWPRRLL